MAEKFSLSSQPCYYPSPPSLFNVSILLNKGITISWNEGHLLTLFKIIFFVVLQTLVVHKKLSVPNSNLSIVLQSFLSSFKLCIAKFKWLGCYCTSLITWLWISISWISFLGGVWTYSFGSLMIGGRLYLLERSSWDKEHSCGHY